MFVVLQKTQKIGWGCVNSMIIFRNFSRLRTSAVQLKSENSDWNEVLALNSQPTEPNIQKHNLANLQNCLASLKYEMAVLQKKLAPSHSNSPAKKQQHSMTDTEIQEEKLVISE